VAQLAVVGGVPSLSALLAGLNAALAIAITGRDARDSAATVRWSSALAIGYAALLLGGVPVAMAVRGQLEPVGVEPREILLVQPNLAPGERWAPPAQRTNLAVLAEQTATALAAGSRRPDLIAWPETSLTSPIDRDEALGRDLLDKVDGLGVPLVLGAVRAAVDSPDPRIYRNSVLWVAPGRGIVDAFDKTRAVPLVESARTRRAASLLGLETQDRYVEEGNQQRPVRDDAEFAVVLCNEALYPGLVSARRGPKTVGILNLANDSWFLANAPSLQQLAFSSFRAIEQRLPLLRVAHGGVSAMIDPYGRVEATLPFATSGTLRATVAARAAVSAAERAALLGLFGAGSLLGAGVATVITRRILS
jgi:apolipoprotein N-acyltransferase